MSDKDDMIVSEDEESVAADDEIAASIPTVIMSSEDKKEMEEVAMTETPPMDDRKVESPEGAPEDKLLEDSKKEKERRGLSLDRVKDFFHKDRLAKVEKCEEPVLAEKSAKEKVEVIKSPRRWFKCEAKTKKHNGHTDQSDESPCMTVGLNLLDRDEHNMNETVKLNFDNIFAEPEGWHSVDCAWRAVHRVYKFVSLLVYRILALLVFLPLAIIWGFVFAFLAASHVWLCTPFARAIAIPATWLAKVWNFAIRSLFDPCFRSLGLCLGGISVRRYGFSQETTQDVAMMA